MVYYNNLIVTLTFYYVSNFLCRVAQFNFLSAQISCQVGELVNVSNKSYRFQVDNIIAKIECTKNLKLKIVLHVVNLFNKSYFKVNNILNPRAFQNNTSENVKLRQTFDWLVGPNRLVCQAELDVTVNQQYMHCF